MPQTRIRMSFRTQPSRWDMPQGVSTTPQLPRGQRPQVCVRVTGHQAPSSAATNASSRTLIPQAPGSDNLSRFSRLASMYVLLPTRALRSRVASATSALRKSDGFAEYASANAASVSMSVRDGGRARIYVYNCPRAAETVRDQSCSAATPTPLPERA